MTKQEVIDYITLKLATPITLAQNVIDSFLKLLDFSSQSAVDDVIPDWTALLTFELDGSGAGKYCLHPDTDGKKRIFETKIAGNLNNPPPTDTAVTENASWVEISQSAGSGISEWAAGVYGSAPWKMATSSSAGSSTKVLTTSFFTTVRSPLRNQEQLPPSYGTMAP